MIEIIQEPYKISRFSRASIGEPKLLQLPAFVPHLAPLFEDGYLRSKGDVPRHLLPSRCWGRCMVTSQLQLDGQSQSNWATTHDEDRPTGRVFPTKDASGLQIQAAAALCRGLDSAGRSSWALLLGRRLLQKASARIRILHSAPAGPRRSSSSNRLQMRGHFQWPPSPHSCDLFCTLLLACVPKAGWPAHNSIELLIGEGCIAVVRKPCRCFNHRASGCLLNGRISRLTQSLQGPHPLLLRCDLVSS